MNRRTFIEFLGKGTAIASLTPHLFLSNTSFFKEFKGINPSDADELKLAKGLNYDVLIKWGDPINMSDTFGFNNDYTAFLPFCLLYTSPSPRDRTRSRMPSSA